MVRNLKVCFLLGLVLKEETVETTFVLGLKLSMCEENPKTIPLEALGDGSRGTACF